MTNLIAFLAFLVALLGVLVTAGVALYGKRQDRQNAAELRNSEVRELVYERLLAAGDAAWYYGTLNLEDADAELEDADTLATAVADLFNSAGDQLAEHTRDPKAIQPTVSRWFMCATQQANCGPREFENARDAVIDLKRQEIGYRKRLNRVRELSWSDRFLKGERIQRLPDGVHHVLHLEDGGFMIQGSGDEFNKIFMDMVFRQRAFLESRATTRRRLAEWRGKGV